MLAALAQTGWHNYSLFLREDGLLIGYVETPSLEQALAGMARTAVNGRWQAEMAGFFQELDGGAPDQGFLVLEEVFRLEDQLAQTLPPDLPSTPTHTQETERDDDVRRDRPAPGGPGDRGPLVGLRQL